MSASQEKKTRAELRTEGNDKKVNAAAEQDKKSRQFRIRASIAAVLVVIVIAAAILINSNLFYTGIKAVQIGDTKYSAAEVTCYYQMAYNTIYNQYYQTYGDYTSYFLDNSKPLSEQQYSEEQTWADYLREVTLNNMTQLTALYDEAVKNGYTLSETDAADIESGVSTMASYASNYGYANLDAFLVANYGGKGMNEQLYRDILTKNAIAYGYADQVQSGYSYDAAALESYYTAHTDELDFLDYDIYYVASSAEAFTELAEDAKAAAAHDAAAEIAAAATHEDFAAAVQDFTGTDSVVTDHMQGQSLDAAYSAWMLDGSRAAGDATVVDTDNGSYALLYLGRNDNHYPLTSMRHILVKAVADENGEYTDEALATAETAAQDIYKTWQVDPSEDNFAALANEHSEDEGSNTNGGLYENIYRHNMVDTIDEFLFDAARKPGDTAVVYGTNVAYAGYHVVYYIGQGEQFSDYLSDNRMRSEDYAAFLEALEAPYTTGTGFGMKFADLN